MSKSKGKKGYMAFKIDQEKAYDKIEWSFIKEMLANFKFSGNLLELIMSCVSSVSTSLLFNGGCLEPFRLSQGTRQGDLLSPYLFILCMEYLGYLIEEKCEQKCWTPFNLLGVGLPSRTCFSQMILSYFPKLTQITVPPLKKCYKCFALN